MFFSILCPVKDPSLIPTPRTLITPNSHVGDENKINGGMLFLYLVSLYWTAQVISNIVHVTTAGVVATWYFLHPQSTPSSAVCGSFKRATTTSFGSICFGSFLVAIIQATRVLVRMVEERGRNNQFIMCCIRCILRCLQDILEYFNLYAFSRVAIYGTSYWQSAKETWELFKSKGTSPSALMFWPVCTFITCSLCKHAYFRRAVSARGSEEPRTTQNDVLLFLRNMLAIPYARAHPSPQVSMPS